MRIYTYMSIILFCRRSLHSPLCPATFISLILNKGFSALFFTYESFIQFATYVGLVILYKYIRIIFPVGLTRIFELKRDDSITTKIT